MKQSSQGPSVCEINLKDRVKSTEIQTKQPTKERKPCESWESRLGSGENVLLL